MTEAKDRAMDIGFGVGATTLDPLYGALRPAFPNLFGTAWDLSLEGHWGVKTRALQNAFCSSEDCYERSARASLRRRRILASPLDFDITGELQRRVTPARGQIDSASGAVRLTWPISADWRVYLGYLIQIANVSKDLVKPVLGSDTGCGPDGNDPCNVINRGEAIVPDRTGALETGVVWETVDNAFNPHDGIIAQVDFMLASPWLAAWDWWMRVDASWMQFIPLPRTNDRLSFQYSLRYGHAVPFSNLPGASTSSIPEVWRYFGGGTVDLGLRGIRPQTMLVDVEEIDTGFGVTTLRPTAQGGHIRALGTVALQVVSWRKFLGGRLAHSLFVDVGVLTQRWRQVRPGRDIRRSIGVNFLKWDIPNIVTMALGYAILIPDSIIPGGNVSPTDDPNGRLVFDVGVTF
jgi:outer membrane protein assembly factor BamA